MSKELNEAAGNGDLDKVKELIAQGHSPKEPDAYGRIPLFQAAYCGHREVLEYLLNLSGDDINQVDKDGNTLLHVAAGSGLHLTPGSGYMEVVEFLLNKGIEVNKGNNEGRTALHLAIATRYRPAASRLLEAGANVNQPDKNGNTPLWISAWLGHTEEVKLLLKVRPEVNHANREGNTALHIAAQCGHRTVAQWLVHSGANLYAKNKKGSTPLDVAKNRDVARAMIQQRVSRSLNAKAAFLSAPVAAVAPVAADVAESSSSSSSSSSSVPVLSRRSPRFTSGVATVGVAESSSSSEPVLPRRSPRFTSK